MFFKIYKTTLKNLFRSAIFWAAFATVILIVFYFANRGYMTSYDPILKESIPDTDPRFVLRYEKYLQTIFNSLQIWVMYIGMPIFAVISTVLVLNRNFSDSFYEIEKAGGVRPSSYLLGRLAALASVNVIVAGIASLFGLNYYYFTRGGVSKLKLSTYLTDSTMRILRTVVFCELPVILLFIGLAYMIGSLIKNGFAGFVGGTGIAITLFWIGGFRRLNPLTEKYYNVHWINAYKYFTYYDTEYSRNAIYMPSRFDEIIVWISVLVGAALFCFTVSYLCARLRTT